MILDKARFISDLLSLTTRNVRWRHQGREPETGLDCIGLPRWGLMQQMGALPEGLEREFDAYQRRPDGKRLLSVMRDWFDEVGRDDIQPADMVVVYDWSNPQHIAIMVNQNEAVEAYCSAASGVGKVLRQKLDPRRRIAAIFRFPESGERLAKWQ